MVIYRYQQQTLLNVKTMCLIALAYKKHPNYPFLLSANRDEFYNRPANFADYWKESPQLLAGRDCVAGGTWLGITTSGRFAAITNYSEEGSAGKTHPLSRGELSRTFLAGNKSAEKFLVDVRPNDKKYGGFNLLLMDNTGLFCYSNRDGNIIHLEPGVYGLSNHKIDTPWPKVKRAKKYFKELLKSQEVSHDQLFSATSDRKGVLKSMGPGIKFTASIESAKPMSAQFITSEDYGTRANTTIMINKQGLVQFRERNFLAHGQKGKQREYSFFL